MLMHSLSLLDIQNSARRPEPRVREATRKVATSGLITPPAPMRVGRTCQAGCLDHCPSIATLQSPPFNRWVNPSPPSTSTRTRRRPSSRYSRPACPTCGRTSTEARVPPQPNHPAVLRELEGPPEAACTTMATSSSSSCTAYACCASSSTCSTARSATSTGRSATWTGSSSFSSRRGRRRAKQCVGQQCSLRPAPEPGVRPAGGGLGVPRPAGPRRRCVRPPHRLRRSPRLPPQLMAGLVFKG